MGEISLLIHFGMPMNAASVAESAQSLLQSGSRVLLMIAMTLFLAYLLFLLSAVTISSALTKVEALRRPVAVDAPATVTSLPLPLDDGWGNRVVKSADDRAMSA